MMKRIILIALCLVLVFSMCLSVSADSSVYKIYEIDYLLSDSQRLELSDKLDRISQEYDCMVTVATTEYLTYSQAQYDAREIYNKAYKSYNEDGILLLVCMNERKYGIYTCGELDSKIFKDDQLDSLEAAIKSHLTDGDVYKAFDAFADKCDEILDNYHNVKVRTSWIFLSLGIGIVIAFIVVLIMKSQLKSVRYQSEANNYLKSGSFNVTLSRDIFLYSTITRTPKPQSKSSGGGSSSGGGRSGSF